MFNEIVRKLPTNEVEIEVTNGLQTLFVQVNLNLT